MPEPTTTAEQLNDLRRRYLAGEEWSREELKSAIHTMIGDRLTAVQNAEKPKAKRVKAQPVSLDDMLPKIGVDLASGPDKTATTVVAPPKEEPEPEPKPTPKPPTGFF